MAFETITLTRNETYAVEENRTGSRTNEAGDSESYSYTVTVQKQRIVTELVTREIPEPVAERAAQLAYEAAQQRYGTDTLTEAQLQETTDLLVETFAHDPTLVHADDATVRAALEQARLAQGTESSALASEAFQPPTAALATAAELDPGFVDDGRTTFPTGGGGGAGSAGNTNPYPHDEEFGYALHEVFDRFGADAAAAVQDTLDDMNAGLDIPVSTAEPAVGDVMVWTPNAGDLDGPTGQADGLGHVGVVHGVADNGDGTVTVRVAERNWDNADGVTEDGVPYRDIRLERNPDGTLDLPDGVGFLPVNPDRPAAVAPPPTATGPQNPPLGPNALIDDPNYQAYNTTINTSDDYTGCLGYIHDIPAYAQYIQDMAMSHDDHTAAPDENYLAAREIPINSDMPMAGGLMVWGANTGDNIVGTSNNSLGHVAYVEAVQPNFDPPNDPTGTIESYTVTISDANGAGGDPDNPSLRTFTVAAGPDGAPLMPEGVGFHNPPWLTGGGSVPSGTGVSGGTGATGTIPRQQNYTVQAGDTLSSIAERAGVSVESIVAANDAIDDPNAIREGQRIYIP